MKNEQEFSALKISPEKKELIRQEIVAAMSKNNSDVNGTLRALETVGVTVSAYHVRKTWKAYSEGGFEAISAKKVGAPVGHRKLSSEQEERIKYSIEHNPPEKMGLAGHLWTRELVAELIMRDFNVHMPLSTMGLYLSDWGFTAQRPTKRHYKQNQDDVDNWLNNEFPSIKERAETEGAEIFWGDEAGIHNETNCVKGYAPKGQTPVLPVGNEHKKVNMVSAISNIGKLFFLFFLETINQQRFIIFMNRLIQSTEKKVFLIVDNLKVHHGEIVTEWLKHNKDRIELFFLPSYSPQLNPDEYLNGNVKRNMARKGYSRDEAEIERKANGTMSSFDESHIASLFENENIQYAAASNSATNILAG